MISIMFLFHHHSTPTSADRLFITSMRQAQLISTAKIFAKAGWVKYKGVYNQKHNTGQEHTHNMRNRY